MEFIPLSIPDVILVKPKVFPDARGFFMESWRRNLFENAGINLEFVQDNHSKSSQGVLRGMHYQIQHPQGKLVRAVIGEIFDVVVDMRSSSPFFGKWAGATLSAENHHMLWVPPGFAHGFLVLSKEAEFLYKATDYYAPEFERCVMWNDPQIGINWPLNGLTPLLSPKDEKGSKFCDAEVFS